jgi:hypothetical protein
MKQKILNTIRIIILSLILSTAIGYSLADWAPPTSAPPFNNTPPPINVGPASQTRDGNLFLNQRIFANKGIFSGVTIGGTSDPVEKLDVIGNVMVTGNMRATGKITAGTGAGQGFCLGPSCITSWPINSAGTYTLGANLNMSNRRITNVANPVNPQDAATKSYVDGKINTTSMKYFKGYGCGACPYGVYNSGGGYSCYLTTDTGSLAVAPGWCAGTTGSPSLDFGFWSY